MHSLVFGLAQGVLASCVSCTALSREREDTGPRLESVTALLTGLARVMKPQRR